jgi:hypothetical protein
MPDDPKPIDTEQTPDELHNSQDVPPLAKPTVVAANRRRLVLPLLGFALLLAVAGGALLLKSGIFSSAKRRPSSTSTVATAGQIATNTTQEATGLQLDGAKQYGDKYANGILPVGDNQYTTAKAEKGKVYACNANFVPAGQAGAQTRGPWFIGTTQWNINKKAAVRGSVSWQQNISNKIENGKRVIITNDLPDHKTGTFPVASSDPAYLYDRNPNTIKAQSLTYSLAAAPTYGEPQCMGGEAGVMLTGVALFNGFDAGGRDAGAWEVQDSCQGHPQGTGIYHYHTLSACIKDTSVSTVIGFALDGFPITGPRVGDKNYLTTSDLDECHGIVSEITLDGKKTTTYHYVMTQDFPYSASCFRAPAIQSPGQHVGGSQQSQQQAPRP